MARSKNPKDPSVNCLKARWASRSQENQGFTTLMTSFYLPISNVTTFSLFTTQPFFPTSKSAGSAGNPTPSTKKCLNSSATSLASLAKPLYNASLLISEWKTLTMCLKLSLVKSIFLRLHCLTWEKLTYNQRILRLSIGIFERWRRRVLTLNSCVKDSLTKRENPRTSN